MPTLKNQRNEQFAQAVATGEAASRAYARIYDVPTKQAEASGPRLLGNARVAERVTEIRQQAEREAMRETILTIQAKREFCAAVVRAKAGELDETSPLVQSYKVTKSGREIRLCDKLKALEIDSKLAGHFLPQQQTDTQTVRVRIGGSPDGFAEFLSVIRAGDSTD